MELHYRGAIYEAPANTVEVLEGEVIGKYRGAELKRHEFRNLPAQPHPRLRYRGAWVR